MSDTTASHDTVFESSDMAPCQVCASRTFSAHLRVDDANFSERVTAFEIVRCNECGFCRMEPPPSSDDLQDLYVRQNLFSEVRENPYRNNPLFPVLEPVYRRHADGRRFFVRNCRNFAPRRRDRPLRVLDIGCSTGALIDAFLEVIPDAEVTGIDIDPGARENAPEHLREHIVIGDVLETQFDAKFDIVTMEMVIKHLPDPATFLRRCADLLVPGGVLMVSTPNIDSKPAIDGGADWWLVNRVGTPVGHIFWFNPRSLARLATTCAFIPARIRSRGSMVPYLPRWLFHTIRILLGTDPHS